MLEIIPAKIKRIKPIYIFQAKGHLRVNQMCKVFIRVCNISKSVNINLFDSNLEYGTIE